MYKYFISTGLNPRQIIHWIAKNFSFAVMAYFADAIIMLLLLVLMGRSLGPSIYGEFATAYAVTNFFFLFTSMDLALVISRKISRNRELAGYYLGNAVSLSIILVSSTALILIFVTHIIYPVNIAGGISILSIYFVCWHLSTNVEALFASYQKMIYQFWATIVGDIVTLIPIFFLLFGKTDLPLIEILFSIGAFARLGADLFFINKIIDKFRLGFDRTIWWQYIKEAFPLGLSRMMRMVYWRVDTVILSLMLVNNSSVVGEYSAAYNILSGITLPARSFNVSAFPIFARASTHTPEKLNDLFRLSFIGLAFLGLILAIPTYFLAPILINLAYGSKFSTSVDILRILAVASFGTYLFYLVHTILPAIDRVKPYMIVVGTAAGVNVILNVILIPHYQAIGSAIATLATEYTGAIFGLIMVIYFVGKNKITTLPQIEKEVIK